MESQGVGVLCVWNKFMEDYEKGVFVVRNVSCPEMPGAGCTEALGTGFTLKMSSSSSPAARDPVDLNSFFFSSSSRLLGHGDQRHAVHCDRVCKERRNVW